MRANSNNEVEELIDFNVNQGSLDYKVNSNIHHPDSSWLGVKILVPQKEMLKPPSKKKKVQQIILRQSYLTVGLRPRDFNKTGGWVKQGRRFGTLTMLTI